MKKTPLLTTFFASSIVLGCSTSSSTPQSNENAATFEPASECTAAIDAIYGAAASLPANKGDIIACARDRSFTREDLEARARGDAFAYQGKPFTSGAKLFRVSYRTERGDAANSPGYTSALVFVPDTPRAATVPAVVVAHGTAGQAGECAPSKAKWESKSDAYAALIFPLVGSGLPVIAPDYAGYAGYNAPNNAPSGYALAADVGKSVLDGARALRKMFPKAISDKTVLVGQSQGGHSVLSALALSEKYAPDVPLSGVVAYSPLWLNQASWGAMLYVARDYPVETSAFPIFVGLWYHYSHGELLDGPGHGVDVFAASKREGVKKLFDSACIGQDLKAKLQELGVTTSLDLYDPEFVDAISKAAAVGQACPGNTNKELCEKWVARYAADRPHIKGAAARVPVLVPYGTSDETIPPTRASCGFERLKANRAQYNVCVSTDPKATHNGIMGVKADYVNDWIANLTLGTPAPAACDKDESAVVDSSGARAECATPPPND